MLWQLSSQNKAGGLVMTPANSDILILPPLIKLKKIIKKSCQSRAPSDQPFWIRALLLACTQTGQKLWFDTSWLPESQLIWMYNILKQDTTRYIIVPTSGPTERRGPIWTQTVCYYVPEIFFF